MKMRIMRMRMCVIRMVKFISVRMTIKMRMLRMYFRMIRMKTRVKMKIMKMTMKG